jgi:hypothetical protein
MILPRSLAPAPVVALPEEQGPSQFFVNQSGLPMTFHVVLDEEGLMEPLEQLIVSIWGLHQGKGVWADT